MLRSVVHLVLVVIIVVAAAAFFMGYRWGAPHAVVNRPAIDTSRPVATSGGEATAQERDTRVERARETGAQVGEKVAVGAERAGRVLDDAGITTKVKSKIVLDDTLKGSHVEVSTTDHVVTLDGSVASAAQHQRALSLARETEGVQTVIDHLRP